MGNSVLRKRLIANISDAIHQARAVADLDHQGSKGTLREIAVQKLLRPLMRGNMDVTSGIVMDSTGRQSPQMDAIVYSTDVLPPIMIESTSVVPAEAVLQVFEIKSKLTADELRKCLVAAGELRRMRLLPPGPSNVWEQTTGHRQRPTCNVEIIYSIFAFDTDLKAGGKTEFDRFEELRTEQGRVHDLCVAGRGYWVTHGDFSHTAAEEQHAEVVRMLKRAVDTWPIVIGERKDTEIGPYFEG